MKSTIVLSLLVAAPLFAQWQPNDPAQTGAIYYNGGNVGVGTASPGELLTVNGAGGPRAFVVSSNNGTAGLNMQVLNGGSVGFGIVRTENNGALTLWTGTTGANVLERLRIGSSGNVGIGTAAPSDRLHLGNAGPGGITIDTGGATKGRLVTAVSDWIGMTANASFNGNGWVLDDSGRDGWFVKLDARSGYNKFAVWRIPAGTGEHHNETELLSLDSTGKLTANNISAQYQDVAEWVSAAEPLAPGTVVVIDPAAENGVTRSTRSYDTSVAGVVSALPGITLGQEGKEKEKIATTGRVKVRADATGAPIRVGDLLVTSDKPGVAMRSKPVDVSGVEMHRPGTLIGKALQPLPNGEGEILVLLSLQ